MNVTEIISEKRGDTGKFFEFCPVKLTEKFL